MQNNTFNFIDLFPISSSKEIIIYIYMYKVTKKSEVINDSGSEILLLTNADALRI